MGDSWFYMTARESSIRKMNRQKRPEGSSLRDVGFILEPLRLRSTQRGTILPPEEHRDNNEWSGEVSSLLNCQYNGLIHTQSLALVPGVLEGRGIHS
jgi:hypothetical protein